MATPPAPDAATTAPSTVALRSPSIYAPIPPAAIPPSLPFLIRSWAVTHSTLPMWRNSRNVRISYTQLASRAATGQERHADLVEHEPTDADGNTNLSLFQRIMAPPRTVEGVNTATRAGDAGSWDWRGKGMLGFVTSHWEILGWGERPVAGSDGEVERWAVTWFGKTMFSAEGLDVYCDRREGISEETYALILDALKGLEAKRVVELVEKDMRPVRIVLGDN